MNESNLGLASRLLNELAEMAEQASLTGSLRGGEKMAALTYNRALRLVVDEGAVPAGLFEPLEADQTDYSVVGVQARLLMSVLPKPKAESRRERRTDDENLGAVVALAPFLSSDDLAQMLRERIDEATEVSDGLLTALAPFLSSGDLGQLVRRRMRPSAPPAAPTPPPAPQPPVQEEPRDLRPVVSPTATLESLARELQRTDLTTEDRQRIATRLAELAYEQSLRD